jgi:hypothetical protein
MICHRLLLDCWSCLLFTNVRTAVCIVAACVPWRYLRFPCSCLCWMDMFSRFISFWVILNVANWIFILIHLLSSCYRVWRARNWVCSLTADDNHIRSVSDLYTDVYCFSLTICRWQGHRRTKPLLTILAFWRCDLNCPLFPFRKLTYGEYLARTLLI